MADFETVHDALDHTGLPGVGAGGLGLPLDTVPGSPNALDDEFESAGSLDAAWTGRNLGAATATVVGGRVIVTPGATGSDSVRYWTKSLPAAGAWTDITAKLLLETHASVNHFPGLFLRNSANGRLYEFGYSGAAQLFSFLWNSDTSWSADVGFSRDGNRPPFKVSTIWLRIARTSATNVTVSVSLSGIGWVDISDVAHGLGAEPDQFGFGSDSTANAPWLYALEWIRLT